MKHYLDYNATAPVRPEVLAVMQELQRMPLNASSVHAYGRNAKHIVDVARRSLAEIISAFASEIIFTASGTESNNWALRAFSGRKFFVSAIEHSSVLKTAHSLNSQIMPVGKNGVVDMNALAEMLPDNDFLVSVMLANNETGIIQPISDIAKLVHGKGGLLHCDAVQAFGKIPVDFTNLDCDLMTLSAHKMGGPIGAATLIVKNNLPLLPMLIGGGQELNRRAGTENVAAIAGFAKSAELMNFDHMRNVRRWLDKLEEEIILAAHASQRAKVIGGTSPRLPNTSCITMPNISAETQLIGFDLEGIAVSAGSACSSGRIEPSHVLKAMQIPDEEAATAIRISSGWGTREEDIIAATQVWKKLYERKNK